MATSDGGHGAPLDASSGRDGQGSGEPLIVGDFGFTTPSEWSVEQLTGFVYSTSVLSQPALGRDVEAFERDLRARLLDVEPDGIFREELSFSYTLARSP